LEYRGQSHVTLLSLQRSYWGPNDRYDAIKVMAAEKGLLARPEQASPADEVYTYPGHHPRDFDRLYERHVDIDKHASVGPDYRPKGCGNVI
jgi:hypothetical protein